MPPTLSLSLDTSSHSVTPTLTYKQPSTGTCADRWIYTRSPPLNTSSDTLSNLSLTYPFHYPLPTLLLLLLFSETVDTISVQNNPLVATTNPVSFVLYNAGFIAGSFSSAISNCFGSFR